MTPAHTDSPLRRSEAGVFRDGVQNVVINDDEEERRQARRRTLLRESGASTTLEESETLKKCLEIYNGNKLSKDNAWSLSLIDTLSTLMDKHHKSLNNFKVAGSSLEASSKVYGLRVDSIHTDVLRMSAGLNAHKFSNRAIEGNDDDDDTTNGQQANVEGGENNAENPAIDAAAAKKIKQKRTRKPVSTVTKNKESLNARLDTVPLTDPVFGKLNSIVGSINSSNRLLNNILPSTDSELRLRLNFQFWESSTIELLDYTENYDCSQEPKKICEKLININFDELELRPMHGGYVISDTPEDIDEDADKENIIDSPQHTFENDLNQEMSMAFDINADVEPIPLTGQTAPLVDVDFGDYEDLTCEERGAINQCKGLRKAAVLIEDLRPIDASSKLEYSYRPLDKISQFWAGPSHWKFKKTRPRSSVINADRLSQPVGKPQGQRGRQKQRQSKYVNFGEFHDDLFQKLDDKFKSRKVNLQKKWDARKLRLPTDLQLDPNMFYKFRFAPGIPVEEDVVESQVEELQTEPVYDDFGEDEPHHMDGDEHHGDNIVNNEDGAGMDLLSGGVADGIENATFRGNAEEGDQTILEIATDFEGAPSQVTKIIVPFAKRAKVIDMKSLKKCCTHLLRNEMSKPITEKIPELLIPKDEQYGPGVASFNHIYTHLPEVLTPSMTEALSPSVAFYSILHLANDLNLRLIPQDDLKDFKIRQVL